jgi:hypothetical protein
MFKELTMETTNEMIYLLEDETVTLHLRNGEPIEGVLTVHKSFQGGWMIYDQEGFWYIFLIEEVTKIEGKDIYIEEGK